MAYGDDERAADDNRTPPNGTPPGGNPLGVLDALMAEGEGLSLDELASQDFLEASAAGIGGESFSSDPDLDEPATDPDQAVPGSGAEPEVDLSADEKIELAHILCQQLDEHDEEIEPRRKKLDRVMRNYNMEVDSARTGEQAFSAQLCSELTKSTCDQATARLSAMVLNTRPLIQVKPVDPDMPGTPDPSTLADSTQMFLEAYSEHELQIRTKIPLKIQTCVQQGDAVTYDMWEETEERVYFFNDDGESDWEDVRHGGIKLHPVHYREFFLWPLGIQDWQTDYEFVGHTAPDIPRAAYEDRLRQWGLPESEVLELSAHGHTQDPALDDQRKGDDVDPSAWSADRFRITEIWYNGAIGPLPSGKYKIFLDRDNRRLIRCGPNPLHCRQHPYRPFRYKRRFNFAYSEGAGEELIMAQAIASTIDNMSTDNWKVVGSKVMFYDENHAPQGFFQDVYPGARVGIDGNPSEVIMMSELGGPVEALLQAKADNDMRAMKVTGLPPVLTGSGDPTMKSGADASSIMALISEAGRKFGHIDATIKEDFSHEVEFWLELIAQYAPEGFFRGHISPERALPLQAMKYIPPRGRFKNKLRIEVTAPSPSSNKEVQKQHILLLSQMVNQYMASVERLGMEVYAAEGQQEQMLDLKRQIFGYITRMWQMVTELHEIQGLIPLQPSLDAPTPDEQKIDQLRTQLVQSTQQLQQMGAQMAVYQKTDELTAQGLDPASARNQAQNEVSQAMEAASQQPPQPGLPSVGGPPVQ